MSKAKETLKVLETALGKRPEVENTEETNEMLKTGQNVRFKEGTKYAGMIGQVVSDMPEEAGVVKVMVGKAGMVVPESELEVIEDEKNLEQNIKTTPGQDKAEL